MEFGFVIFLLSSALFGHSSGFTTPDATPYWDITTESTTTESSLTAGGAPCGGTLTQSQGEFFSPNYPNNYPNYAHCTWSLLAGELQVVSLNFTFIDLEPCCDFIHVYNGPTAQHSLLGSVTGNQRATFISSSRYMTVVFSSDVSVTPQGFRAEWAFIDFISCRDHCGYNGTLCSCTSSCQSYGNCCNDYYDYCFNTTTTTTQESTTTESSLTADYISCRDHCGYNGALCSCTSSCQSYGNCCNDYYDYCFTPTTTPTTTPEPTTTESSLTTARVDCSSDSMNIAIRKSYLDSLGFSWYDLYLDDHRCRASTDNYYVTFNFRLHSCSTRRTTENGRIIYTNNVRAAQPTSDEITRNNTVFPLVVRCVMERDSSVEILYEAKEITNAAITGTGRFNTTMAFYPSSSFYYPITDSPYRVNLNQQLYVQVQLTPAEPSLHLFMDSCVASPNHDYSSRTYDLIRNGCQRDNTVNIYRNGNRYFARFSFSAFKFLRTHNQVFLKCDVIICPDNDYNSRCRQGCSYRRKRSTSSDHHTEVLILGPITLKGPEEAEAKTEDKE